MKEMTPNELKKYIDHTCLDADVGLERIAKLCAEAKQYGFANVCVNPWMVKQSSEFLQDSGVGVCTVIGFPLGATLPEVKAFETEKAIEAGASEVDMVMNIGALKSGNYEYVEVDIKGVVEVAHAKDDLVKVILESAMLSDEELIQACNIAYKAGADFVKTSSGYGPGGATLHAVALMKRTVGDRMGIKASTGIRDYETVKAMIAAGATRFGVSRGIRIITQAEEVMQNRGSET